MKVFDRAIARLEKCPRFRVFGFSEMEEEWFLAYEGNSRADATTERYCLGLSATKQRFYDNEDLIAELKSS